MKKEYINYAMSTFTPYPKKQFESTLTLVGENIYTVIAPLDIQAWCSREPMPFIMRADGASKALKVGDKWGSLFDCAWFCFRGKVPPAAKGRPVVLLLDVNGEMCVFNAEGVPQRGLTTVSFSFDLGIPGKRVLPVISSARGGEMLEVWADAGCNGLLGGLQEGGVIREASIAMENESVHALYYDFEVLLDFLDSLPENAPRYRQILLALKDVSHLLSQGVTSVAEQARDHLRPFIQRRGGVPSLHISAVGHAHIDLAWLWPIRETIRKGARSFSTAIANLDAYSDYVFGASQPQYFQWMKEYYPPLYEKIKAKVTEGRIELQGAMWVEADTNIVGGESLVRQLLYGRRFFNQEFDVDVRYLWLPEIFGYSGNLPQILKKAGIDIFATKKLSWSLNNRFLHHSFHWQGIDGSRVLVHMFPEDTCSSSALPHSVRKIEQNYHDSDVSEHALMVFGARDGGGGPGEEHLERLERIRDLEGISPVKQESAAQFFECWRKQADRFSSWVGELYLGYHQGSLTTNARNKYYNRKLELGLRELEWSSVLAKLFNLPPSITGSTVSLPYPVERLKTLWSEVLLYQCHEILPGTSIKRVYDESLDRYHDMYNEILGRLGDNDRRLARFIETRNLHSPIMVQNSLSWERSEWLLAGDRWVQANIPEMGYSVMDVSTSLLPSDLPLVAESDRLENDFLSVKFAPDASIISIIDKRFNRELITSGAKANRLAVYVDLEDAGDFAADYAEHEPRHMALISSEARVDGPRAVLKCIYRLAASELTQEVILTAGSPRLDFVSSLHWREPQAMLRTAFPLDIRADEATFEIQFGYVRRPTHRNTAWDLARDEAPAHRWADLSQPDYGVALLNDSKYGHKIKGNIIELNLLRSVPYPGPILVKDSDVKLGEPHHAYTDQADHQFTYALFPHPGDAMSGGVVRAGYELNVPLRMMPLAPQPGVLPRRKSFIKVDRENVIIEAVKQAEEGDGVIIRLYEAFGCNACARLSFGFPVISVEGVDLMEENPVSLEMGESDLVLDFQPFEIKTIKILMGQFLLHD